MKAVIFLFIFGLSASLIRGEVAEYDDEVSNNPVFTANQISDSIHRWMSKIHRSQHIAPTFVHQRPIGQFPQKVNDTLSSFDFDLVSIDKDINKVYSTVKTKIRTNLFQRIRDSGSLVNFVQEKDFTNDCMDSVLENLVKVNVNVLRKLRKCAVQATSAGQTIVNNFTKTTGNLKKNAELPVKQLSKCTEEAHFQGNKKCIERKLELFISDIKDVTAELHASLSKAAANLVNSGIQSQICMDKEISQAEVKMLIVQFNECE